MIRHAALSVVAALGVAACSQTLLEGPAAPAPSQPATQQHGAAQQGAPQPGPQPAAPSARAIGYVARDQLPNIAALLPPPPAPGTAAKTLDEKTFRATRSMQGGPRWELAAADVPLVMPKAMDDIFSCALGAPIDPVTSPNLVRLLARSYADAGISASIAKDVFKRQRPFSEIRNSKTCQEQTEGLARNFAYPSGHAAVGMAMGYALAEVAPDRRDPILQRARAFGDSRVVCGVHWLSDVAAGREAAGAAIAIAHANPEFAKDVAAARVEVAALRAAGATPSRDCAKEAAALAIPLPGK